MKGVVNMRQMIGGDVVNESVSDFIFAHAAMQPTKEDCKLHADGEDGSQDGVPMGGHGGPWEAEEVKEVNEAKAKKNGPGASRSLRILYLLNFFNLIYFRRVATDKNVRPLARLEKRAGEGA
jgi:hypothetical protein